MALQLFEFLTYTAEEQAIAEKLAPNSPERQAMIQKKLAEIRERKSASQAETRKGPNHE